MTLATRDLLGALLPALAEGPPLDIFLTQADDLARYGRDWTGDHQGRPGPNGHASEDPWH